jgi:hypothetical protein
MDAELLSKMIIKMISYPISLHWMRISDGFTWDPGHNMAKDLLEICNETALTDKEEVMSCLQFLYQNRRNFQSKFGCNSSLSLSPSWRLICWSNTRSMQQTPQVPVTLSHKHISKDKATNPSMAGSKPEEPILLGAAVTELLAQGL